MKKMLLLFMVGFFVLPLIAKPKNEKETKKVGVKPLLLVIDTQNDYMPMMSQDNQEDAIKRINYAIWLFREHNYPIIFVYHTDPQRGPEPGSDGFKFPESIDVRDTDQKVTKNFGNAFKKTDLHKLIQEQAATTLFMCGLSATGCVLATYFGAGELDYQAFMIEGALLSPKSSYTEVIEEISRSINLSALKLFIENLD